MGTDKPDPSSLKRMGPVPATNGHRPWDKKTVLCSIAQSICHSVPFVPGMGGLGQFSRKRHHKNVYVFCLFFPLFSYFCSVLLHRGSGPKC